MRFIKRFSWQEAKLKSAINFRVKSYLECRKISLITDSLGNLEVIFFFNENIQGINNFQSIIQAIEKGLSRFIFCGNERWTKEHSLINTFFN